MKPYTSIIVKQLAKILALVFVLMAIFLLVFNLIQRKIETVEAANDQAMLMQEQELLNRQILSLQEDLRQAARSKRNIANVLGRQTKFKKNDSNQSKKNETEKVLENTEKYLQKLLDNHNDIYHNNILLIENYKTPERLDYEIKRSELLLDKSRSEDDPNSDQTTSSFDVIYNTSFLFRRNSAEQMEDDLPFLLANQAADQNPYRTDTSFSGMEMMTKMLQSPISYIVFLFSTIPIAFLLTSQFTTGRMNTFFQMDKRKKVARICMLISIGFWVIAYLMICLMIFGSGFIQRGVGNGEQLLQLADKTIITTSDFIKQRVFAFSLFSLQMTLLFVLIGMKSSSIRTIQLVSGVIIITHYVLSVVQSREKTLSGLNPLSYLNMSFDVLTLRNINYLYLFSTITILIFFIRQHFMKYEDR